MKNKIGNYKVKVCPQHGRYTVPNGTIDKGCPKCPKAVTPKMVGEDSEPSGETYTSKHGLVINKPKGMGDTHFKIFCSLADKDPDIMANMALGRYMPRQNGMRIHYRGRDAVRHGFQRTIIGLLSIVIMGVALYAVLWFMLQLLEASAQ